MKSSVASRFGLDFDQQIDDRRLHRDVERRDRLVGHHQTRARPPSARAMATRCFWPPESWRGLRATNSVGRFTVSSSACGLGTGLAAADAA